MKEYISLKAEEIAEDTALTEREAQLYQLHVEKEKTLQVAADEMGTEKGTEKKRWDRVKRKIREARETAKLEIPGEEVEEQVREYWESRGYRVRKKDD